MKGLQRFFSQLLLDIITKTIASATKQSMHFVAFSELRRGLTISYSLTRREDRVASELSSEQGDLNG